MNKQPNRDYYLAHSQRTICTRDKRMSILNEITRGDGAGAVQFDNHSHLTKRKSKATPND